MQQDDDSTTYNQSNSLLRELYHERTKRLLTSTSLTLTHAIKYLDPITSSPATHQLAITERPGLNLGSHTWDGALLLSNYIQEHPNEFVNRSVIELGSGTGVAGLTAGIIGAKRVVLTDLEPVIPLLTHNIHQNRLNDTVEACELDWLQFGKFRHSTTTFDVILGADIVYNHDIDVFDGLLKTVNTLFMMNEGSIPATTMYLSYRRRDQAEAYFFEMLSQLQFNLSKLTSISMSNKDQILYKITCGGKRITRAE